MHSYQRHKSDGVATCVLAIHSTEVLFIYICALVVQDGVLRVQL